MQFVDNEVLEGNAAKNYVGGAGLAHVAAEARARGGPTPNPTAWRWQFNGGSVGCITATAPEPFTAVPSTAWMTFRRNMVHNSGGIFVGTSHETLESEVASDRPSVGSRFVVEHNIVRSSPVCCSVNKHFTQVTERGNSCP